MRLADPTRRGAISRYEFEAMARRVGKHALETDAAKSTQKKKKGKGSKSNGNSGNLDDFDFKAKELDELFKQLAGNGSDKNREIDRQSLLEALRPTARLRRKGHLYTKLVEQILLPASVAVVLDEGEKGQKEKSVKPGQWFRAAAAAPYRSSPMLDSEIVGKIGLGETVQVIETQELKISGWLRIRVDSGWLSLNSAKHDKALLLPCEAPWQAGLNETSGRRNRTVETKQQRDESRSAAAATTGYQQFRTIPISGQFVVQDTAALTEQADPRSAPIGMLHRGQVVEVLQGQVVDGRAAAANQRLKLSGYGWASLNAPDGTELFSKNKYQVLNAGKASQDSSRTSNGNNEKDESMHQASPNGQSHDDTVTRLDDNFYIRPVSKMPPGAAAKEDLVNGFGSADFFRARQKVSVMGDSSGKKAQKIGTLSEGTLIEGLELSRTAAAGRQIRCHQGWVTLAPAYFERIPRRKLKFLTFEFDPTIVNGDGGAGEPPLGLAFIETPNPSWQSVTDGDSGKSNGAGDVELQTTSAVVPKKTRMVLLEAAPGMLGAKIYPDELASGFCNGWILLEINGESVAGLGFKEISERLQDMFSLRQDGRQPAVLKLGPPAPADRPVPRLPFPITLPPSATEAEHKHVNTEGPPPEGTPADDAAQKRWLYIPLAGFYVILCSVTVRAKATLASPILGELPAGAIVEVVEGATNAAGHIRLCCYGWDKKKSRAKSLVIALDVDEDRDDDDEDAGWVSMYSRAGTRLLRPETVGEAQDRELVEAAELAAIEKRRQAAERESKARQRARTSNQSKAHSQELLNIASNAGMASEEAVRRIREAVAAGGDVEFRAMQTARTPLLEAAAAGHEQAVAELLDQLATSASGSGPPPAIDDVDMQGLTALMLASVGGYQAVVEILLQAGADVLVKDAAGLTAMQHATRSQQSQELQAQLATAHAAADGLAKLKASESAGIGSGASGKGGLNADQQQQLATALEELHASIEACHTARAYRAVEWLAGLDSKHAVNTPHPRTGRRALGRAAELGSVASVALLLEEGALPDLPDHPPPRRADAVGAPADSDRAALPVWRAVSAGQVGSLALLLAAGAQIDWLSASGCGPTRASDLAAKTPSRLTEPLVRADNQPQKADGPGLLALALQRDHRATAALLRQHVQQTCGPDIAFDAPKWRRKQHRPLRGVGSPKRDPAVMHMEKLVGRQQDKTMNPLAAGQPTSTSEGSRPRSPDLVLTLSDSEEDVGMQFADEV
eukprot:SAG31_NODE_669_length_12945_cov_4.141912_8_plen_1247_part_00